MFRNGLTKRLLVCAVLVAGVSSAPGWTANVSADEVPPAVNSDKVSSGKVSSGKVRTDRSIPPETLFTRLADEDLLGQLHLTPQQQQRLLELSGKSSFYRSARYGRLVERLVAARTDQERETIRTEISQAARRHRDAVRKEAWKVLTREQQLLLRKEKSSAHSVGTSAQSVRLREAGRPAEGRRAGRQDKSFVAAKGPSSPAAKNGPGGKQPVTTFGTSQNGNRRSGERQEKRTLSFNFQNAPWKEVLEYFAEKTGLTLDAAEVPDGTFNYHDASLYTPTEALDMINGYLLPKNFILVRRGRFLVVHNLEKPVPQSIIPDVAVEELPYRGRNELMRVTFVLKDIDVKEAANEVKELQAPYGTTVPVATANRLVVTDIGSNLLRIHTMLKDVTRPKKPDDLSFRAFPLQHIPADEAEKIVSEQLNASRTVRNVSAGGGNDSSADRRREFFRRMMAARYGSSFSSRFGSSSGSSGGSSSSRSSSRTAGDSAVRVTSDARTNSLLVLATAEKVNLAEQIIQAIDVPMKSGNRFATAMRANQPYFKVYKVTRVDAREVTKTLTALMNPDSIINEDGRNGTIHIFGTADEHRMAEELIREMDGGGTGGQSLDVVPLKSLDPVAVANTLKSMFANEREGAPTIEADAAGRQLLVKGSQGQIVQIRKFVEKLESSEAHTRVVGAGQTGTVRRLPIPGDPEQFLQTLQQMWSHTNPGNPIRIVPLEDPNPIRERKTPAGKSLRVPGFRPTQFRPRDKTVPSRYPTPSRTTTGKPSPPFVSSRTASQNDLGAVYREVSAVAPRHSAGNVPPDPLPTKAAENVAPQSNGASSGKRSPSASQSGGNKTKTKPDSKTAAKKPAGSEKPAPVVVMIRNGELVLLSSDKEALDRMQKLVGFLLDTMPQKTTWTVFYLQAADCTEAAAMLEQLFPSSSVASTANANSLMGTLTGGIRSFGNSLVNMTGANSLGTTNTLRIIPEVRSNALFVTGPASLVRDVERVLKVLDASDLPANLRERTPRMIPVHYADVNEVANIVRDVYKDYMQPAGGSGSRSNFNPLSLLLGGRGGSSRSARSNSRQQQVQLTLGVDERTGQLVVSANDTLFKQVQELVYELDKSAYDAQRTTRVVQLENTNASVVTQTLTAMYPNVTVSGTTVSDSRNRAGNAGQNRGTATPGSSGNADQERLQRIQRFMMFRQMLNRQNGGSGGGTGGRGGFDGVNRPSGSFGSGRSPFGGRFGGRPGFGGSSRFGSGRSGFGGFGRGR